MKKACLSIFAFALLGSLLALPASAADGSTGLSYSEENRIQNGPCSWVCSPTSNCTTECIDDNNNQSDCGDYGVCGGGSCTPNWVLASSQPIGGFAEYFYFPSYWCRYHGIYRRTWHDTNGCQPDYQDCIIGYQTTRPDLACCTYFWCGGNTCGYN